MIASANQGRSAFNGFKLVAFVQMIVENSYGNFD